MKELILEAWGNRELLKDEKYVQAVKDVIEEVDKGRLRTAEPVAGGWQVNEWVKQAERDTGRRPGPTTEMAARLKALERENRELRQANEILRKASAYFAQAELDRPLRK